VGDDFVKVEDLDGVGDRFPPDDDADDEVLILYRPGRTGDEYGIVEGGMASKGRSGMIWSADFSPTRGETMPARAS
jgi:hypothetical protein